MKSDSIILIILAMITLNSCFMRDIFPDQGNFYPLDFYLENCNDREDQFADADKVVLSLTKGDRVVYQRDTFQLSDRHIRFTLLEGRYILTELLVLSESDEVIYAIPNSDLAVYENVCRILPISVRGRWQYLEVVKVDDYPHSVLGYPDLDIGFETDTLRFDLRITDTDSTTIDDPKILFLDENYQTVDISYINGQITIPWELNYRIAFWTNDHEIKTMLMSYDELLEWSTQDLVTVQLNRARERIGQLYALKIDEQGLAFIKVDKSTGEIFSTWLIEGINSVNDAAYDMESGIYYLFDSDPLNKVIAIDVNSGIMTDTLYAPQNIHHWEWYPADQVFIGLNPTSSEVIIQSWDPISNNSEEIGTISLNSSIAPGSFILDSYDYLFFQSGSQLYKYNLSTDQRIIFPLDQNLSGFMSEPSDSLMLYGLRTEGTIGLVSLEKTSGQQSEIADYSILQYIWTSTVVVDRDKFYYMVYDNQLMVFDLESGGWIGRYDVSDIRFIKSAD